MMFVCNANDMRKTDIGLQLIIGLIVWKLVIVRAVNLTQFYQNVIIDVDEREILNNWNT